MDEVNDWMEQQQAAPLAGEGITMMHLLELPPPVRALLRLLLRRGSMSRQDLACASAAQPQPLQLSGGQLDTLIEMLSRQGWLQHVEGAESPRYRLHLRPKTPAASGHVPPGAES